VWDNPRLLNLAADVLYAAAAVLLVMLVWHAALRAPQAPLRAVTLTGELARVEAQAVQERLAGRVTGNFFGVNLDEVRRLVGEAAWVRHVEVRREWPDRLVVRIEEHRPLARWTGGRLVSEQGELFEGSSDAALPQLAGPPGSEREVTRRYLAMRERLAPIGLEPVELTLSPRQAWQARLSNGLVLALGRDQARSSVEDRLARFAAAYPRVVASLNQRLDYVDLRYPNGFAIRVPDLPQAADAEPPARRRS
jgi:cell division protein FtsQ